MPVRPFRQGLTRICKSPASERSRALLPAHRRSHWSVSQLGALLPRVASVCTWVRIELSEDKTPHSQQETGTACTCRRSVVLAHRSAVGPSSRSVAAAHNTRVRSEPTKGKQNTGNHPRSERNARLDLWSSAHLQGVPEKHTEGVATSNTLPHRSNPRA